PWVLEIVEFWSAGDDCGRCVWIGWTTGFSVRGKSHFLATDYTDFDRIKKTDRGSDGDGARDWRGHRGRDLSDTGGHGEGAGLADVVARGVAHDGSDGVVWRALLWRAVGALSRGGRWLCLLARSLWASGRFHVRLDGFSGNGSGVDCCARSRPRDLRWLRS